MSKYRNSTRPFVSEKLKELYDVHLGKSQVGLYMSRTSWLKYNPAKKCYEVSFELGISVQRGARRLNGIFEADDDFEFFIEENEESKIDKIEEIDLAEKPKRKNAKKSSKKKGWFQTKPDIPFLVQCLKIITV